MTATTESLENLYERKIESVSLFVLLYMCTVTYLKRHVRSRFDPISDRRVKTERFCLQLVIIIPHKNTYE